MLARFACAGKPFYKEHEGKRYCVLHYPSKDKSADFQFAVKRKLETKDFDFSGVWFPDAVSFRDVQFDAPTNFTDATFNAWADFCSATFSAEAKFLGATFSALVSFIGATFGAKVNFSGAHFSNATFFHATFGEGAFFYSAEFHAEADFRFATFREEAAFSAATFSAEADFREASFGGPARFREVRLVDHIRFAGEENLNSFTSGSSLELQFTKIEKPERVSFHSLTLHPHWFINVDARKFDFTNVNWNWLSVEVEVHSMNDREIPSPYRLLCIACRHLAVNAEENHRYEEASKFRYMAMEARRVESWRGFAPWRLGWWYWLASGYGERVWQAFFVLLGILLLSALLYNHVGFARWEPKVASEADLVVAKRDDTGAPLKFSRALTYSAGVMILQKPEPRPATTAAQTVVLLERSWDQFRRPCSRSPFAESSCGDHPAVRLCPGSGNAPETTQ